MQNNPPISRPLWLKSRGYLHITPKLDLQKKSKEFFSKVTNENFVANHAFFPLVHSIIKERKYKKVPDKPGKRAHSYKEKGKHKRSEKIRPLHYSTHIDAVIFGYYSSMLLERYEKVIQNILGLSDCITAYRKIPIDSSDSQSKGKSTIHFAFEAFNEIKNRSIKGDCAVLMFDIKSFFNELDHEMLRKSWCDLMEVQRLNSAHYNVFKAATDFRYILKDELRQKGKKGEPRRRLGFDERKLHKIRKKFGVEAFFESPEDFRNAIKNKMLRVYKHPFKKKGKLVGIPQGLPISSLLANLYLLNFDKDILNEIVIKRGGYYRRYSDDIMVICKPGEVEEVKKYIRAQIGQYNLEISESKTEVFLFKHLQVSPKKNRLVSILCTEFKSIINNHLIYLGFEFTGEKILIKSSNIARFNRKIIYAVKKAARRAKRIAETDRQPDSVIYKGRLLRLIKRQDKSEATPTVRRKFLVKNSEGEFEFKFKDMDKKKHSNYFGYAKRAEQIIGDDSIFKQLKKRKRIFYQALERHFKGK